MHITVDRATFLKATQRCNHIINKRAIQPMLLHVLLEADDNTVKLTSTDLENSILQTVATKVKKPGRVTVSAEILNNIIRTFKDNVPIDIEFVDDKNQLRITSGRSRFMLATLNADNFPSISNTVLSKKFTMPAADLHRLVIKTKSAMSSEETKYYLNGIYLHNCDNTELRAVATDGHRLAQTSAPLPEGAQDFTGVIISRKTVGELLPLLMDNIKDDITIEFSDTQISFKFADIYLTARLIDGIFPDYQKVIPVHNNKKMIIKMSEFSEAVARVTTVTDEKMRAIHMDLNQDKLTLTVSGLDSDHAQQELIVHYPSDEMKIGFNAKYLSDISADFAKESEAEFAFDDTMSPVIIRDSEDKDSLYVIMPMRI